MQRIVVLGGSGFIGRALVTKLASLPEYQVVSFGRSFSNQDRLGSVEYWEGEFTRLADLQAIFQPGDIIFDLITSSVPYTSMQSPLDEVKTHIFSQVQCIEMACKVGVKQILFTSSGGGVYGEWVTEPIREDVAPQPVSPHAISKVTIEHFLNYFGKLYGISHITFRLSNPYGPLQHAKEGFGLIPTLFSHIHNNHQPILFNHGNLVRDFIFIDDLIEAMTLPLTQSAQHSLYNIGSGHGTSLKQLWEEIKAITGTELEPVYQPKRPIDVESIILNIDRFKNEFQWQPKTSLHQGLERCWTANQ